MPLQLNLLHEEIAAQRQRKRDPLKLGVIALCTFGAILFLYYMWNAYETINIRSQLNTATAEWQKVEPQVTKAQRRATELTKIINSTKVLDDIIGRRFYWAPLLSKISQCVAPNIQLTALDGSLADSNGSVVLTLEGVSAAREPRAAAEDFRQLLSEQLEKSYKDVKVEFKNLEDLDTSVNLGGTPTPSSRFILSISLLSKSPASDEPAKSPATDTKVKK